MNWLGRHSWLRVCSNSSINTLLIRMDHYFWPKFAKLDPTRWVGSSFCVICINIYFPTCLQSFCGFSATANWPTDMIFDTAQCKLFVYCKHFWKMLPTTCTIWHRYLFGIVFFFWVHGQWLAPISSWWLWYFLAMFCFLEVIGHSTPLLAFNSFPVMPVILSISMSICDTINLWSLSPLISSLCIDQSCRIQHLFACWLLTNNKPMLTVP